MENGTGWVGGCWFGWSRAIIDALITLDHVLFFDVFFSVKTFFTFSFVNFDDFVRFVWPQGLQGKYEPIHTLARTHTHTGSNWNIGQ